MVIAFDRRTFQNSKMTNPSIQPGQNEYLDGFPNFLNSSSLLEEENNEFISTAQLYEAVYKNAFHPMYIEANDGKIVKFNEKFSELFGFPLKEAAQLQATNFFETDEKPFISFINQRVENGFAKAEITGIKKSGERFPCRISSVIYESDNGEIRSINTLVNISENLTARWSFLG